MQQQHHNFAALSSSGSDIMGHTADLNLDAIGGSGNQLFCHGTAGPGYNAHMFAIYEQVVARGLLNFLGARIKLHTNLDINQWNTLVDTAEDKQTVAFLQNGSTMGYPLLLIPRQITPPQTGIPNTWQCISPLRSEKVQC